MLFLEPGCLLGSRGVCELTRLLSVMPFRTGRGTSRGTTTVSAACDQRTQSTEAALSVQAERPVQRAVLMVRRRSTVRFRKGAPVQRLNSKDSNGLWGQKWGERARNLGTGSGPGVVIRQQIPSRPSTDAQQGPAQPSSRILCRRTSCMPMIGRPPPLIGRRWRRSRGGRCGSSSPGRGRPGNHSAAPVAVVWRGSSRAGRAGSSGWTRSDRC